MKNQFSCEPGIQEAGEDRRHLLPLPGFFFDLLSARSRELIKLRLPIVVRDPPLGSDRPFLFEFEESRIKRSVVNREKIRARLLNLARNPVAMQRACALQRFQDHQRQGPLPNIGFAVHEADNISRPMGMQ